MCDLQRQPRAPFAVPPHKKPWRDSGNAAGDVEILLRIIAIMLSGTASG